MDLLKIGKYIAKKRRDLNLTQEQLAEQLGKSAKSVSKWERGVCLPDAAIYLELCHILGISLNEFFAGEDLEPKDLETKSEENILAIAKAGIKTSRKLKKLLIIVFILMIVITGSLSTVILKQGVIATTNYIEPIPPDSREMQMFNLVHDGIGGCFYEYAVDDNAKKGTITKWTYQNGKLIEKTVMLTSYFQDGGVPSSIVGITPSSIEEGYRQVDVILVDNNGRARSSGEMISDKHLSEQYGCVAQTYPDRRDLGAGEDYALLVLYFGKNKIHSAPIDFVEESARRGEDYCEDIKENPYSVLFTVRFDDELDEDEQ